MTAPEVDPSLVTIETVERLLKRIYDAFREGRTEDMLVLIREAADETTRRTVSAVKDQNTSDAIAALARQRIAYVMATVESERAQRAVQAQT